MGNVIDDKKEVTLEEINVNDILTAKKSTPIKGNVVCDKCGAIIDKEFNTEYWGVDDKTFDEPDSDEFGDILDTHEIDVIKCPYCGNTDYATRWYQAYTDDIINALNAEELFPGINHAYDLLEPKNEGVKTMNEKMNLQEATIKALYSGLDDSDDTNDVEGIIDDVLVVTDPEVTTEEYNEIIDRAQEIVEETPEGDIPFDESYIGDFLQTCPICGATFAEDHMLEPGATCPICFEKPESFVVLGQINAEDVVLADNNIEDEVEDTEDMFNNTDNAEDVGEKVVSFKDEESIPISNNAEKVNASKEISSGNKLVESDETNNTITESIANNNGFNILKYDDVQNLAYDIAEDIKSKYNSLTIDDVIDIIENWKGENPTALDRIKNADPEFYASKLDTSNKNNEDNISEVTNQFLGFVEDILTNELDVDVLYD